MANVEDYKHFVPFCNHSHVHGCQKSAKKIVFEGELGVGFNMFQERYTSIVACEPYSFVQVNTRNSSYTPSAYKRPICRLSPKMLISLKNW